MIITQVEILAAIQKLPLAERLAIAEGVLHTVREEMSLQQRSQEDILAHSAQMMLSEYEQDGELTAFTHF